MPERYNENKTSIIHMQQKLSMLYTTWEQRYNKTKLIAHRPWWWAVQITVDLNKRESEKTKRREDQIDIKRNIYIASCVFYI